MKGRTYGCMEIHLCVPRDIGPLGPLPLISSIFGPLLAFEGRVVQPLRVKIPVSNLCFSSHTRWHRPMGQCNTFVLKNKKMFLILRLFWALADLAVSSLGSQSLVIHLFFSNHSRRVQMMSKSKTRLLQSTTIWALNQTQNYTSPSGFSGDKGGGGGIKIHFFVSVWILKNNKSDTQT